MKCSKCGTEITPGRSFCSKCGTAVVGGQAPFSVNSVDSTNTEQKYKPDRQGTGTGAFILGLMALICDCLTCCLGAFIIPPLAALILGILGIIYGNKGYKQNGWPKANAGRVMAIVALAMWAICVIIHIVLLIIGAVAGEQAYYNSLPWYEKIFY